MFKTGIYASNPNGKFEKVEFTIEEVRECADHAKYKIKAFVNRAQALSCDSNHCGVILSQVVHCPEFPDLTHVEEISATALFTMPEKLFDALVRYAEEQVSIFERVGVKNIIEGNRTIN